MKSLPREREFTCENVDGFIEEGETKAKKKRKFVLRGFGIPSTEVTVSGNTIRLGNERSSSLSINN